MQPTAGGASLVNWWQDIYPEIAVRLEVPFVRATPIRQILAYLRDRALKKAKANVVIAEGVAAHISSPIHVIHNWSDDDEISPVRREANPLRQAWGLTDKFVIGYSGNLGRAHEFETVLGAAERLRHDSRMIFLFIGGGHQIAQLAGLVKERGLDDAFRFVPYQKQAVLKYSLGVPDVHWISLRPELEGLIVPSKFYGIAAAGRAMIAITARDGEIARLIEHHQCGLAVAPGDVDALEKALVLLSTDNERCMAMGACARAMLEAHFTRRQAFERWDALLQSVGRK